MKELFLAFLLVQPIDGSPAFTVEIEPFTPSSYEQCIVRLDATRPALRAQRAVVAGRCEPVVVHG